METVIIPEAIENVETQIKSDKLKTLTDKLGEIPGFSARADEIKNDLLEMSKNNLEIKEAIKNIVDPSIKILNEVKNSLDKVDEIIKGNINFYDEFKEVTDDNRAIDKKALKNIKISPGPERNRLGQEGTKTITDTQEAIQKFLKTKPNFETIAYLYKSLDNIKDVVDLTNITRTDTIAGIKTKIKNMLENSPYTTQLIISRKSNIIFTNLRQGLGLNVSTDINELDKFKNMAENALYTLENNINSFGEVVGEIDDFLNTKWRSEMRSIFSAIKEWVLEIMKTENIKTILLFLSGSSVILVALITTLLNINSNIQSKTKELKNDNKNDATNKIVNPLNQNIEIAKK